MASEWVVRIVSGSAVLVASGWISFVVRMVLHRRQRPPRLDALPDDPPAGGWPTLAVAFAARNEAAMVGAATRSMLAQDYPGLNIIAVDDRSTDGTGAILDDLARADSRLSVIHVETLPPGWLGKNHALQAAAESTTAEWVLLTDADVVFAPAALRRAVAYAVAQRLDHLTMAPDVITVAVGERAFMAMFSLLFILHAPPWRVIDRRSKAAMGVGAFNLVRAEAFHAISGFRRLALSVDDDMKLGQALKFAGYRPGLVLGQGQVVVRWHVGIMGMIRGIEKNFYAAVDFKRSRVVVALVALPVLGVLPYVGVFVGPWWARSICAAGVGSIALMLRDAAGISGIRWYHALVVPIGALACFAALARSVFVTLRNGGVLWRDHLYPLAELKTHVARRNAWLNELWRSTR